MESKTLLLPTGSESSFDKPDIESHCFNDELVFAKVVWVFLRICVWRGSVPAAEAKITDNASIYTLRTPRPPDQTGRLAESTGHHCMTFWEPCASDHWTDKEANDCSMVTRAEQIAVWELPNQSWVGQEHHVQKQVVAYQPPTWDLQTGMIKHHPLPGQRIVAHLRLLGAPLSSGQATDEGAIEWMHLLVCVHGWKLTTKH